VQPPVVTPGAIPQVQYNQAPQTPTQMPAPTRSPGSPVSQPPSSR
jgi:hypothetical protein